MPPGGGSGRLQLADWLTDPQNPLTARVMVNRIWQGHFGVGLVKTPNDFGTRGEPPTQPELLDYLAARFVESGWSIKAMQRLIMLSETYQLASIHDARNALTDPGQCLAVALSPTAPVGGGDPRRHARCQRRPRSDAGRSASVPRREDVGIHPARRRSSAVYDHNRRSVYLMTQRIKRHPFLALFDGADTSSSTGTRYTTTVPTQALFFLNDPFVHARAASLAARLLKLPDDRSTARSGGAVAVRPAGDDRRRANRRRASCRGDGKRELTRSLGRLAASDAVQQRIHLCGLTQWLIDPIAPVSDAISCAPPLPVRC